MDKANSSEFDKTTPYPVVGLITEWLDEAGEVKLRDESSDLGGTMRLGAQVATLTKGSFAEAVYGDNRVVERHRHRYEVNNRYVNQLVEKGLIVGARSIDGELVEMVELLDHPWFLGCQFHPEFTSTPRDSHPLFKSFILAARKAHEAS